MFRNDTVCEKITRADEEGQVRINLSNIGYLSTIKSGRKELWHLTNFYAESVEFNQYDPYNNVSITVEPVLTVPLYNALILFSRQRLRASRQCGSIVKQST